MFLEHSAILPTHRTKPPHVGGREADQARLHYTACQLLHLAMSDACWMACILAENRGDASPEFRQGLQQLHLCYLRLSRLQLQYDYIDRQLEELSRKLPT